MQGPKFIVCLGSCPANGGMYFDSYNTINRFDLYLPVEVAGVRAGTTTRGHRFEAPEAIELAEIAILEDYLPEQLSDEELDALIEEAVSSTGAESIRDMGKVMGAIKAKAAGRADMGAVGAKVKARLGQAG